MNKTKITLITAFLSTILLATEAFGLGFGGFRKHRRPFKKPLIKKVQPKLPITLAFDSLKSLGENGPIYILQLKLFNNGHLELSMFKHGDRFNYSKPGKALGKTTLKLNKRQMYLAMQQVKTIANTPIHTQKNKNLCGVIPPLDKGIKALYSVRNFNHSNNTFKPGLELVENTKGCWAKFIVSPTSNKAAFDNLRNLLNKYARSSFELLINE